eukprot:CAMPEP_0201865672 /NCGR_PEP_ID=MMETSP0902-20130614/486_1 /ASSEMBLY_ACC=CAM_ASM_000551 /TAXON_ID=420261 /ORGANISM="Thalassiosira antarctica, Strain CCMP982" /LENGTH=69 /DNA_ID=CAMNT_0048390481 /DNA_START=86 /DNA_END=295 /DNA_ORIENTATION=+
MYKCVLILAAIASASAFAPAPRQTVSRTIVRAEDVDYQAQFTKLQKEAEERLDEKVEELMKNIETVGQA